MYWDAADVDRSQPLAQVELNYGMKVRCMRHPNCKCWFNLADDAHNFTEAIQLMYRWIAAGRCMKKEDHLNFGVNLRSQFGMTPRTPGKY